MSKIQLIALFTLLASLLFVGMAQAQCGPYFYWNNGLCCKCPEKCRRCSSSTTCLPGYCDSDSTYNNGLCYVTIVVVNAASRAGILAAVGALCATVVALVY